VPSNSPNFYSIKAVSAVVVSLYVSVDIRWSGVCEGHGTDVPRTGMYTAGFGKSTRLLLRVTGR
jgi:hypothetical protein